MTRSEITFWVFITLALVLSYFVLAATAGRASATDWDWSLSGDSYHQPKKRVVRKKVRRVPDREDIRLYRAEDDEYRFCAPGKVRGLGTQWIGPEGALEAAKKDFMERVRYDLGESYLDLTHAKEIVERCGRVSIGKVLDQVMYRCEIIARPCKAEFSQGDVGK